PRTRVRLSVRGDGRAEGMLVGRDGGTIILGGAGEERRVPGAAMDSAWVRGNSAGTGALIGALAAGVALGTLLAVDDNERCSRPGSDSSCNTPLFFGVGFGV